VFAAKWTNTEYFIVIFQVFRNVSKSILSILVLTMQSHGIFLFFLFGMQRTPRKLNAHFSLVLALAAFR
jgi:hypothetical protein